MNARDWGFELMEHHREVLSAVQVGDMLAYDEHGDGWLAAYDLFRDGVDDGWITRDELTQALSLARAKQFAMLSAEAERVALAALDSVAA